VGKKRKEIEGEALFSEDLACRAALRGTIQKGPGKLRGTGPKRRPPPPNGDKGLKLWQGRRGNELYHTPRRTGVSRNLGSQQTGEREEGLKGETRGRGEKKEKGGTAKPPRQKPKEKGRSELAIKEKGACRTGDQGA